MAYIDLAAAKQSLAQQVASGGIQQWQMDNELNRLRGENLSVSKANLAEQVRSGGINQAQADAELARLTSMNADQLGSEIANPGSGGNPGAKGPLVQPTTGVHIGPGGIPIAPAANVGTAEDAISTQEQYGRYNVEQQLATNRVNEVNPYGSSSYTRDPVTGAMTRSSSLSAPQQQMLDQQQQRDLALGNASNTALSQFGQQGAFSYGGLPQVAGQEDLLAERRRVEDQLYSDFEKRQAPIFEQEKQALSQSLADRGIPLTSARAQTELQQLADRQEQTRSGIRTQATQLGQSEYSNNFNTSLANRQQGVSEYDKSYYAPLTTMGSLQGLQAGITNPDFSAITKVDVPLTDPAAIGSTYRGQDITKYLGELDANAKIKAAQIAANAAKYATDASNEDGASDFMGMSMDGYNGGGTGSSGSGGTGSSGSGGTSGQALALTVPGSKVSPPSSGSGKPGSSSVGKSKTLFGA
jgi:hypothetical protein